MYWWGLFHWSHGSTGSEDPCLLVPGRYYRSRQAVLPLRAVLPLPASGTTAWGGTTAPGERYYRSGRYYRGSPRYYRDPNRTHPTRQIYLVHFFWAFASHFSCSLLLLFGLVRWWLSSAIEAQGPGHWFHFSQEDNSQEQGQGSTGSH